MLWGSSNLSRVEWREIGGPYGELAAVIHHSGVAQPGYVLVISHGFRGSKDGGGRAVQLAEKAAAQGFTVVRFDFSPQGMLTRQVAELTAVVEYCRVAWGGRVILIGRSMGGSASLAFAEKDQDIAGLCLWATPWNLVEIFRSALGSGYDQLVAGDQLVLDDEYGLLVLQPEFIADFAQYDLLKSVKNLVGIPLLLVHGACDEVVPLRQAREIYAVAAQPKDLVIIPEADHQFVNTHQVTEGALLDWLSRMFLTNSI